MKNRSWDTKCHNYETILSQAWRIITGDKSQLLCHFEIIVIIYELCNILKTDTDTVYRYRSHNVSLWHHNETMILTEQNVLPQWKQDTYYLYGFFFFLFGLFYFCSLLRYFNLSFWLSSSGVSSLVSSSSLTVLPYDSLTPVLRSDWRILMSVHIHWNQNWGYSGPNVSRREKRRNWERTQRRQNKLQERVSGSDKVQRTWRRIRRVIVWISEEKSWLMIRARIHNES